jgi:cytochrome c5
MLRLRSAAGLGHWAALALSAGIALPVCAAHPEAPAPDTAPVPVPVLHLSLPDTPEKRLVEQHCVACHDLTRIQNAGGTRSGWNKRLQRMIARGAKLPLQDVPAVAVYLARQFPVRPRPVDANTSIPPTESTTP